MIISNPSSFGNEFYFVSQRDGQYQAMPASPCYSTPEEAKNWLAQNGDETMTVKRASFAI